MQWIAGIDGCRTGWVVAMKERSSGSIRLQVITRFDRLFAWEEPPDIVAVDIPIGLMDAAQRGGRECDRLARAALSCRAGSVFSAPVRGCLVADSYGQAKEISRKSSECGIALSRQTYGILPRIREVDEWITPQRQAAVFEAHPELSFTHMNDGTPLGQSKRTAEGKAIRRSLLHQAGFIDPPRRIHGYTVNQVAEDDILDAYAMLWTAERKAKGIASVIPGRPVFDQRGLRMEIWC
jgi:predicted RNase H-like nuclease